MTQWLRLNWWLVLAGIAMLIGAYLFANYAARQLQSHPELWRAV